MINKTIEKKIMSTFEKAFPNMTAAQKECLLAYGEGMVAVLERKEEKKETLIEENEYDS